MPLADIVGKSRQLDLAKYNSIFDVYSEPAS